MTRPFVILTLTLLAACASKSAGNRSQASAPQPAENVEDVKNNVKQLEDEVGELVRSMANPASVEDPKSFRGRLKAAETRLSERAEFLRKRVRAISGTPAPAHTQAPAPQQEQELLQRLDQTEKKLDEVRNEVDKAEGASP